MDRVEQQLAAHLKLTILHEQRQLLVDKLTADRHFDFLRSKYILSEDDCEEISSQITRRKRASKFLDILLTKGADAYDMLCESVRVDGTQTFILEILNKDFEVRLLKYRDLVKPQQKRPTVKVIPPPAIQPPPPPASKQLFPTVGGLQPVEHQHLGAITPPLSPDFMCTPQNTACTSTTSVSSEPTAFTDLSSDRKESLHMQETCSPSSVLSISKGQSTVDILHSLSSSSGMAPSSTSSERMQEFSLTSSSYPSSSSRSSSPSIISGISESGSNASSRKLSSRGSEDREFFSSLPQSWREPSSGSESLECHTCRQEQNSTESQPNGLCQVPGDVNPEEKNNNCVKDTSGNSTAAEDQPTEHHPDMGEGSREENNNAPVSGDSLSSRPLQRGVQGVQIHVSNNAEESVGIGSYPGSRTSSHC